MSCLLERNIEEPTVLQNSNLEGRIAFVQCDKDVTVSFQMPILGAWSGEETIPASGRAVRCPSPTLRFTPSEPTNVRVVLYRD